MRASFVLLLALAGCSGVSGDDSSDNQAPASPDVSLTALKPRTDDALRLELGGELIDPDGDDVRLAVEWSVDGTVKDNLQDELVVSEDDTEVGERWKATVTAVDSHGLASEPVVLEVEIDNTPPTVTLAADPPSPPAGVDATVIVTADDDDGDDVTVDLTWSLNGVARPDLAGVVTLPGSQTVRGQVWSVHAVPNDGHEHGESADLDITIADSPPVVTSATVSPAGPSETDVITVTASASDPEGDPVHFEYAWVVDGLTVPNASADTLDGASFNKGQVIHALVTAVSDQGARSAPFASNDVTAVNTAPSASGAAISPSAGSKATTFSCTATGLVDLDPADSPTSTTSWAVNGQTVAATATLDGTRFSRGNSLTCTATPTDGVTGGTPRVSAPVVVGDAPPTLASVTLTPANPTGISFLLATPSGAFDLDGDSVSYQYAWYVNGALTSGTGAARSATDLHRGDVVTVEVTPFDGTLTGAPAASLPVTVANTPPEIQGIRFTPDYPNSFQSVTATPSSYDQDGDTVTAHYAWTVNSVPAGYDQPTLPSNLFARDAVVAVTVLIDDGHGGTDQANVSTTIGDAPPTAATVTLEPVDAISSDELLCQIDTPSTDPDGDPVTYTFHWSWNGHSFDYGTNTSNSSTMAPRYTEIGEDWHCWVTASDGTLTTDSLHQSVIIASVPCGLNAADNGDSVCECAVNYQWCDTAQWDCCYVPPATVRVTVLRAVINSLDSSGLEWDSSFLGASFVPPDAYVDVWGSNALVGTTATVDDSYAPLWNQSFSGASVSAGTTIDFDVHDEDTFGSEYIGGFSVSYSQVMAHLNLGQYTLHGTGVIDLVVRFDSP